MTTEPTRRQEAAAKLAEYLRQPGEVPRTTVDAAIARRDRRHRVDAEHTDDIKQDSPPLSHVDGVPLNQIKAAFHDDHIAINNLNKD